MIPFITFREIDSDGRLCYYILQKALPNYVGIISISPLPDSLANAPVGGYSLYVNFHGVIQGHYVPSYKDVMNDITVTMWNMAEWFLNNRVLNDPKKYSKFSLSKSE
jgi:hypothetical protein